MSQSVWSTINPTTTSGTMLAGLLTDFKDAIMTGFAGLSRPAQILPGGTWIDTTNQGAPNYQWIYKLWTGSVDVEIFRISILSGFGGALTAKDSFEVRQYSEDTDFGILELVKQRLPTADNGQVLSGDVVAEFRFVGHTNVVDDRPTVAHMRWTATDDQTTSENGGTWSFFSTPDASAVIAEHMRFIDGMMETVLPHKVNSLILGQTSDTNVPSIINMSANGLVYFLGATVMDIKGIDSTSGSKKVVIHNNSSAVITIKHQNTSAAAADRFKLPNSRDYTLGIDGTICVYYCTTDARWKILWSGSPSVALARTLTAFKGMLNTWIAPSGVNRIRVISYRNRFRPMMGKGFLDVYNNMYVWGFANGGNLGLGDNTARSSPVVVLGGLSWQHTSREHIAAGDIFCGLDSTGNAYAWGFNNNGQLGDGTTTGRSSPVAVIGGLKFTAYLPVGSQQYALSENGKAYAWGNNTAGQLGLGDVTPRSSPVAVLGGLRFARLSVGPPQGTGAACFGITSAGVAYAWGNNANGQLGLGDVAARSSPVAVLGGFTFKKIESSFESASGVQGMYSYGLTPAGVLYMWGANTRGSLGVGDTTPRSSPVAVLGGLTFVDVSMGYAGAASVYALTEDGTLYAWGNNTNGQLGVGDTTARSSPVAVLGGLKFLAVYPGSGTVLGLTTDGTLYAWGDNSNGQLGVGDITPRSSPVAVLGGLKFCGALSYPGGFSYGVQLNGQVYAWGDNFFGDLGNGTNGDQFSSPVLVIGAHGSRGIIPIQETIIDVVPGQSYDVLLAQTMASFGSTPIGINVDEVTIEYDK